MGGGRPGRPRGWGVDRGRDTGVCVCPARADTSVGRRGECRSWQGGCRASCTHHGRIGRGGNSGQAVERDGREITVDGGSMRRSGLDGGSRRRRPGGAEPRQKGIWLRSLLSSSGIGPRGTRDALCARWSAGTSAEHTLLCRMGPSHRRTVLQRGRRCRHACSTTHRRRCRSAARFAGRRCAPGRGMQHQRCGVSQMRTATLQAPIGALRIGRQHVGSLGSAASGSLPAHCVPDLGQTDAPVEALVRAPTGIQARAPGVGGISGEAVSRKERRYAFVYMFFAPRHGGGGLRCHVAACQEIRLHSVAVV